jgi:hypothetical protein
LLRSLGEDATGVVPALEGCEDCAKGKEVGKLARSEVYGSGEACGGFIELAQTFERFGEGGVDCGVVGECVGGASVRFDGQLVVLGLLVDPGDGHVDSSARRVEGEDLVIGGEGVVVGAEGGLGFAEELVGVGQVGGEIDGVAQGAFCAFPLTEFPEGKTEAAMEVGLDGGEFDGGLEGVDGGAEVLGTEGSFAATFEGFEEFGTETSDLFVGSGGLGEAFKLEGEASVLDGGVEVVGFETGRFSEGVACVGEGSFGGEGETELVVGVEVVRFDGDGACEVGDGLVEVSEFEVGGAELVAFEGVVGVDEETSLEEVDELGQVISHWMVATIALAFWRVLSFGGDL